MERIYSVDDIQRHTNASYLPKELLVDRVLLSDGFIPFVVHKDLEVLHLGSSTRLSSERAVWERVFTLEALKDLTFWSIKDFRGIIRPVYTSPLSTVLKRLRLDGLDFCDDNLLLFGKSLSFLVNLKSVAIEQKYGDIKNERMFARIIGSLMHSLVFQKNLSKLLIGGHRVALLEDFQTCV